MKKQNNVHPIFSEILDTIKTTPKAQHTAGEWRRVVNLEKAGDYCIHVSGKKICELPSQEEEENEANAKLISAAPEMLEALQEMIEAFKNSHSVPVSLNKAYFKCKEAIKQATK